MSGNNINKLIVIVIIGFGSCNTVWPQTMEQKYNQFKKSVIADYSSFRDECNNKYAQFLRDAWDWYEGSAPLPVPEEKPVPPTPYQDNDDDKSPIVINPIDVTPIENTPQPKPIEPIHEVPISEDTYFQFDFYGKQCKIRLAKFASSVITGCTPTEISDGWKLLSQEELNNAIRDCLETRIRYKLCDWAYLLFLDELSKSYCKNSNSATLLMAYLFCQSGYQMRFAVDGQKLIMLYGSKHLIYNKNCYTIGDLKFYPYGDTSGSIRICNAKYEGETPISLLIPTEQKFGDNLSDARVIKSSRYPDLCVKSQVQVPLIKFYDTYPTSSIDGNQMTRWAMYANTPLSSMTKELIYPSLKESIKDLSEVDAANRLLNWVQTGFIYEYDDKIWGQDRAFFAEESLYYPYCDCEDRSILFSRLVRDLLGLDVALVYYPGHLATAVCFNDDIKGTKMIIDGRSFLVCDPTYIGASIGKQMPGLRYDKVQSIVLSR